MKFNAIKFGLAGAISASIIWLVCSLLVVIMMAMSGDMVHMQLNDMGWHLSLFGVIFGMLGWSIIVGAMGWILASIYNRLDP